MLIKEEALRHWIDHFYGYGSWDSSIWFIGYEESGGDLPEEVAEKLDYFMSAHRSANEPVLCNIRDLYRKVTFRVSGPRGKLFSDFYEHRFGANAVQHGFWKNMIAFVHGYKNETLPDLLGYQKKSFAQPSSREALIQLYPLPAHNHAWYYSWLDLPELDFLKSRTSYQEHLFESRMNTILQKINQHKPELVLFYGMDNIQSLKTAVQQFFSSAKFNLSKAIKKVVPQYHRADVNGTKLLITTQIPGLRHNRVGTGFDWFEFGMRVTSS